MPKLEISLPPEVEPYTDDIRRFIDAMVYKLAAKAHKGKWETYGLQDAIMYLSGEVSELNQALRRGNLIEILLEAADVANYGLIISAIAIERGTNGTDQPI